MTARDDLEGPGGALAPLAPEEEAELAQALRAAWAPSPLDPAVTAELVELALGDPARPEGDALGLRGLLRAAGERGELRAERVVELAALAAELLPSSGELVAASTLARELERGAPPPAFQALRSAWAPRALGAERAAALATRAVDARRRSNVIVVAFGAGASVLALAAAIALLVRPGADASPAAAAVPLARSRSTASLFEERFTVEATSARIDRIGEARARDLRANRYASWGVR